MYSHKSRSRTRTSSKVQKVALPCFPPNQKLCVFHTTVWWATGMPWECQESMSASTAVQVLFSLLCQVWCQSRMHDARNDCAFFVIKYLLARKACWIWHWKWQYQKLFLLWMIHPQKINLWPRHFYFHILFPNSVSLGSSAIAGTGSQEQVHKQDSQGRYKAKFPKQGSQEQGFQASFPGTGSQERLPGTIPKQGSQEQVPRQGSQARVPGTVAKQGSQEQVSKQVSQERVSKKRLQTRFPRIGSQARGFQARFLLNSFPSKVRKTRFPSKVRKNRFTSKSSKNSAPSSQARVPRTGFHAR